MARPFSQLQRQMLQLRSRREFDKVDSVSFIDIEHRRDALILSVQLYQVMLLPKNEGQNQVC
jgi:hypothetical protein